MNQLLARTFFCAVPALLVTSVMLLLTRSYIAALIFFLAMLGLGVQVTAARPSGDGKGGE